MSNRLLTHLRHVDLAVPDYDKQLDFYARRLGPDQGRRGLRHLLPRRRGLPEQYVVRLRKADEKRLNLVSYGAAARPRWTRSPSNSSPGVLSWSPRPGKVDTPGGGYGFRFFDVDSHTIEVSANIKVRGARMEKESIPVKLSRVVLNSPDLDNTKAWYEEHLGFPAVRRWVIRTSATSCTSCG